MSLSEQVAANVRRVRVEAGLSQTDLTRRLGVSHGYVSAIERGRKNLTLQSVERLAEALGVDPADLLRG